MELVKQKNPPLVCGATYEDGVLAFVAENDQVGEYTLQLNLDNRWQTVGVYEKGLFIFDNPKWTSCVYRMLFKSNTLNLCSAVQQITLTEDVPDLEDLEIEVAFNPLEEDGFTEDEKETIQVASLDVPQLSEEELLEI